MRVKNLSPMRNNLKTGLKECFVNIYKDLHNLRSNFTSPITENVLILFSGGFGKQDTNSHAYFDCTF